MVSVHATSDEFAFLPEQAALQGRPVPEVRRRALVLPDGRTLSALAAGDAAAGAPRVVLLHGAGLNAHTWDSTVIALGAPVLAVDLAGHGDSSWRDDAAYAPRVLADDVAAAIEEWAHAPVVLVGQSLGGLTAAAVAARRPDLVAHLVVVDITPGIDSSAGPAALRRFYERTVFDSHDALVEHALSFGLGGSPAQARRGVVLNSRVRDDGRVEWKHHYARLIADGSAGAALSPDDGWSDLAAATAPVTLVRATEGFVSPADADDFARRTGGDVVVMDAPHNVQEVAFADLAALISRLADPAQVAQEEEV